MSALLPAAVLGGAAIQGGTSLAGGKKGASAATQAAQLQYQAAQQSLALQKGVYQQIQSNLQPFLDYGTGGISPLQQQLGGLTDPIDTSLPPFSFMPTQAQLEQTPGYQFTLAQALKAGQNQLTASGLGRSSSAVNTAETIAAGLASSTWPQVFNAQQQAYQTNVNTLLAGRTMNLQQKQQIYNILAGRVGTGLSAASIGSGTGIQAANTLGSTITGAGAAQASGIIGAANANIAGLQGVGSAAGGLGQSLLLANALGGNTMFNNPGATVINDPTASAAINARVDALAGNPANLVS